jgi:hypothetical protein
MKGLTVLATFAVIATASTAFAGATIDMKPSLTAQQKAHLHSLYDHPRTVIADNKDIKVAVTTDAIMRSCCMPPNLVISGKVTNLSDHPIDFVHLVFSFEDKKGKVLQAETLYNEKAESMNDDPEVQRVLGEKPHFTPLKPGETDGFRFSIPYPMLPNYDRVELFANQTADLAQR